MAGKISIIRDGVPAQVEWDHAIELHRQLEAKARGLESETLAAFVKWGTLLRQIKASLEATAGHGQWLKFLDTAANVKTAQRAMRLAAAAAGEDGSIDQAEAGRRIDQHNATARDRGVRSISGRPLTVRGAEVAFGVRAGDPAKGTARNYLRGNTEIDPLEALLEEGGSVGGGAGGEQTAGTVTAAGFAAAGRRTESPTRGRSAEPDDHDVAGPVAGERAGQKFTEGSGPGVIGRVGGRTSSKRDMPGQMTLAEEFAHAASLAEGLVRQLRDGSVSADLMRRFVALMEGGAE